MGGVVLGTPQDGPLLKAGVPRGAVEQKMMSEGHSSDEVTAMMAANDLSSGSPSGRASLDSTLADDDADWE